MLLRHPALGNQVGLWRHTSTYVSPWFADTARSCAALADLPLDLGDAGKAPGDALTFDSPSKRPHAGNEAAAESYVDEFQRLHEAGKAWLAW